MSTATAPALFENLGYALPTDYFFLREQLSDDELAVLWRLREFVDNEVPPVIGGYWERAEVPWPLIRRLGELGIVREDIGESYSCPGLSPIACGLVAMARLDTLGAFALTEPSHGSDSVALETIARRDGDGHVINGAKRWIGNGSLADVIVV
jgi:glutaryl-CoA dehydrogenase